jgi:hypothetical protein
MKLWIWRRSPGRELHETTVRKNAIGETVLPDLTETFAISPSEPTAATPTSDLVTK